jgi:flavin-dependent dehydrogenase
MGLEAEALVEYSSADQIIVHTSKGDFTSSMLIGADGVNSIVARDTGLLPNRRTGIALETELAVSSEALEAQGHYATFDFGAIPYGYGWVFPKRDRLTIGVYHAKPGKATNIRQALDTFIRNLTIPGENKIIRLTGHHIPLGGGDNPLHKGRVLLVGDAANLADPWFGEGLYYAIRSGNIAAQVIHSAFNSSTLDLSPYTQTIQKQFIRQFYYANIFASIVYHAQHPCSLAFQRSEILQQGVFNVIGGDLTFKELLNTIGLRIPVVGWQMLLWSGETQRDYSVGNTGNPQ